MSELSYLEMALIHQIQKSDIPQKLSHRFYKTAESWSSLNHAIIFFLKSFYMYHFSSPSKIDIQNTHLK